jgi:hypothetical protein
VNTRHGGRHPVQSGRMNNHSTREIGIQMH